jgi:hypothetical protein
MLKGAGSMSLRTSDVKKKYWGICGEPAVDIICEPCKAKIQAETAHKKQPIKNKVKKNGRRQ